MKKIKKFKIKQNSNNEYSSYHYFIPKSEHIKFADARTLDTEIGDLRNQINELEEKTQYLIDKAPLIGFKEGESSLNLRGCANDEIRKVGIDGNSKQETYSGYQLLFDNSQHFPSSLGGVDFLYNDTYGTFVFNGKPTSSWNARNISGNILNLTAGTYTLYLKVNGELNGNFYLSLYFQDNNNTDIKAVRAIAKPTQKELCVTVTLTEEDISNIGISRFVIEGLVSGINYNITIYPMLIRGAYTVDNIPPYEPYVGGQLSPNPEYPQDIEVIDGVNLFDKDNTSLLEAYVYKGVIYNSTYDRSIYLKLKKNKKYHISFSHRNSLNEVITNDDVNGGLANSIPTENMSVIEIRAIDTSAGIYSFDINTDNENIYLILKVCNINKCDYDKTIATLQITEGTIPKPYLPHGHIGLRQNGINFFNAYNIKNSNIIVSDDGKTIAMPIARSGNGLSNTSSTLKELCPNLKVGDRVYFYFDRHIDGYMGSENNYVYLYGSTFLWLKGHARTITQNDLDGDVGIYGNRYMDSETEQCILTDFRIVKQENTPYEPYHSPKIYPINLQGNSIAKVGDVKDLLKIYRNGDVEIEKSINKQIIDETDIKLTQDYEYIVYYSIPKLSNYKYYNQYALDTNILCTVASSKGISWTYDDINQIGKINAGPNDKTFWIGFRKGITLEQAKEKLKEQILYYELKEPETIQLPSIEPIELWEGTNNFELITNLDTTIRMIYKKDIDALIADSGV